jgi:hypothetical protein
MMVSRTLPWLARRWAAQAERARATGAVAVLFAVPRGCPVLSDELDQAAAGAGLHVLARPHELAGIPDFYLGGPL